MIRLVPKLVIPDDLPRLWLVCFGDPPGVAWWARFCRPGFRHCWAAAWFEDIGRWVLFDPRRRGLVIAHLEEEEFGRRLSAWIAGGATIIRARSRFARRSTPPAWHCVGAVKALLGSNSCALRPRKFLDDLLRDGAEIVEVPGGCPIRIRSTDNACGGPGGEAAART